MLELPWETTTNGMKAEECASSPKPIRNNLFRVKNTACIKMTGIILLSATFAGHQVLFQPYISVLLDYGDTVEFYALYEPDFRPDEENENEQHFPDWCVRHATWRKEIDFSQFQAASHKQQYIREESQITAVSVFFSSDRYPKLLALAEEYEQIIHTGPTFDEVEEELRPWEEIDLRYHGDSLIIKYNYSCNATQCVALEKWAMQWKEAFTLIDYTGGYVPEGDFRISYSTKVEDLAAEFYG